jgi:hypothetical protein
VNNLLLALSPRLENKSFNKFKICFGIFCHHVNYMYSICILMLLFHIYLSIYVSVYLSIYLSVYLAISVSICRSIYLSIYVSVSLSVRPSACPFVRLSVCLSVRPSVHPSIHLWLYNPCVPWPLFQSHNLYIVVRTPWTGDQLVARPLPTHTT